VSTRKKILSLPHSNAACERIFSVVNDIKTKKRNRIGETTLNALCVVRSAFSASGTQCRSFSTTDAHLALFSNNIY
jgi:hypothetical protein